MLWVSYWELIPQNQRHGGRIMVVAASSVSFKVDSPVDLARNLEDLVQRAVQEVSQYFCVDQSFQQASQGIELVLNQKISVDVLERTNRRLGGQADEFLDQLPRPPADQEGELLVFTGDGKGVPLVKEDTRSLAA